jgi:hypothetical protein
MSAPPCDVLGCQNRAHWTCSGTPPNHIEEYICDLHMDLLRMTHPSIASSYTEWTIFSEGSAVRHLSRRAAS